MQPSPPPPSDVVDTMNAAHDRSNESDDSHAAPVPRLHSTALAQTNQELPLLPRPSWGDNDGDYDDLPPLPLAPLAPRGDAAAGGVLRTSRLPPLPLAPLAPRGDAAAGDVLRPGGLPGPSSPSSKEAGSDEMLPTESGPAASEPMTSQDAGGSSRERPTSAARVRLLVPQGISPPSSATSLATRDALNDASTEVDDDDLIAATYVACKHGWILVEGSDPSPLRPRCRRRKCAGEATKWLLQHRRDNEQQDEVTAPDEAPSLAHSPLPDSAASEPMAFQEAGEGSHERPYNKQRESAAVTRAKEVTERRRATRQRRIKSQKAQEVTAHDEAEEKRQVAQAIAQSLEDSSLPAPTQSQLDIEQLELEWTMEQSLFEQGDERPQSSTPSATMLCANEAGLRDAEHVNSSRCVPTESHRYDSSPSLAPEVLSPVSSASLHAPTPTQEREIPSKLLAALFGNLGSEDSSTPSAHQRAAYVIQRAVRRCIIPASLNAPPVTAVLLHMQIPSVGDETSAVLSQVSSSGVDDSLQLPQRVRTLLAETDACCSIQRAYRRFRAIQRVAMRREHTQLVLSRVLNQSSQDTEDPDERVPRCQFCGCRDNLVQCIHTGWWFCNNQLYQSVACIIEYLQNSEWHAIRLSPRSSWGSLQVRCAFTGNDNVFDLGVVSLGVVGDKPQLVFSARDCAVEQGETFHPLVERCTLAPWLCDTRWSCSAHAVDSRGRVRRRQWGSRPMAAPARFSDVGSYYKHFSTLLSVANQQGDSSNAARARSGVTVTWAEGLQGPVACFSYNTGGRDDLRLGESVLLQRDLLLETPAEGETERDDNEAQDWTAVGIVVNVGEEAAIHAVSVALQSCSLESGLLSVDFNVTDNYRIRPQRLDVSTERMQTGLSLFAADEATSCSFRVQQAILGLQVPSGFVSVPATFVAAPKCPKLSDIQNTALEGAFTNPLYRLVGPPGTGKTTTIIQLVYNMVLLLPIEGQILVCAPSNAAASLLARRLHDIGVSVIRYIAAGRDSIESSQVPSATLLESHVPATSALSRYRALKTEVGQLTDKDNRKYVTLQREAALTALRSVSVVVSTCTNAGNTILSGMRFYNVVIDEAGQAIEPAALLPIRLGAQRVTLVGDAKQLGPIVDSRAAVAGGLAISLFARLEATESPFTLLNVQYRMHPVISAFPNVEFYDGLLQDGDGTQHNFRDDVSFPWPVDAYPAMFWHVREGSGAEQRGGSTGSSVYNRSEAVAVVACVSALLAGGVTTAEIGVIAMYDEQRAVIKSLLAGNAAQGNATPATPVHVASVDAFQGGERPFIILSLTRSNDTGVVGFIDDRARTNVALTRAQNGLIIVGDAITVSSAPLWSRLIRFHQNAGAVVSGPFGQWQPFNTSKKHTAGTVTLDTFQAAYVSQDMCTATLLATSSVYRAEPIHLTNRTNRKTSVLVGDYSRFSHWLSPAFALRCTVDLFGVSHCATTPQLPSAADKELFLRVPAFREPCSFMDWPLGVQLHNVEEVDQDMRRVIHSLPLWRDRVGFVEWLVGHLVSTLPSVEHARARLLYYLPAFGDMGLDLVSGYSQGHVQCHSAVVQSIVASGCLAAGDVVWAGEQDDERRLSATQWLSTTEFSEAGYCSLGGFSALRHGGDSSLSHAGLFDTEERMACDSFAAMCLDLLQPPRFEAMVGLLHASQGSSVALLRAERELLSTVQRRLTCAAEGHIRFVQFIWRACIVGHMGRAAKKLYWSLAWSRRPGSAAALASHIAQHRHGQHSGVLVARHYAWHVGRFTRLAEPVYSRVSRYVMPDESTRDKHGRCKLQRDGQGDLIVFRESVVLVTLSVTRFDSLPSRSAPFRFLHRYRPIRAMRCGYGALACLHTVRDEHGNPILSADGTPLRASFMATGADWLHASKMPFVVTEWYSRSWHLLRALFPRALLLLPYGNPGGGGEAARQLGMDAVLTDLETQDAAKWFHDTAPRLYGDSGSHVVVQKGDIWTREVRDMSALLHPRASDVWGSAPSPSCVRGCTLSEFNNPPDARAQPHDSPPARGNAGLQGQKAETLTAEVGYCQEQYKANGVVFMVETTSGTPYVPPDGVVVNELDELCFGCRLCGKHKIYTPADCPLHVDAALLENGERLRGITCPGAARPIQPRCRAGGAPMCTCCQGQLAVGHNSGYFVYDRATLSTSSFYGTHPDHVTSKVRFNNMMPVVVNRFLLAQMAAHSLARRLGVPFITHDDACRDSRLAAWHMGLFDMCMAPAGPKLLACLPVVRVILLATPLNIPGTILVDAKHAVPCYTVPAMGPLLDSVVSGFSARYSGVTLFKERVSFVGDFLFADVPVLVFHTSFVPCNDAYFVRRCGENAGGYGSGDKSADLLALPLADLHTNSAFCKGQCAHTKCKTWSCIQNAAMVCASRIGFVKFDNTCARILEMDQLTAVSVTTELIERARVFVTEGADMAPSAAVTIQGEAVLQARVVYNRRRGPRNNVHRGGTGEEPWAPHPNAVLSDQVLFTPHVAAVSTDVVSSVIDSDIRMKYQQERERLLGKREPKTYGLGDPSERLSTASGRISSPSPIIVAAVGLVVVWKGRLITVARNGSQRSVFIRPLVAYPPLHQPKGASQVDHTTYLRTAPLLRSLFREHLAGYQFCETTESLVDTAIQGRTTHTSWLVSSSDATGRLLSSSVGSTQVNLTLYRVALPDDIDWGVITGSTESLLDGRRLLLYAPVRVDGTLTMAPLSQEGLHFGIISAPDDTSVLPFAIGQLGHCTLADFTRDYQRFGLHRVYTEVGNLMPEVSEGMTSTDTAVGSYYSWPVVTRLQDNVDSAISALMSYKADSRGDDKAQGLGAVAIAELAVTVAKETVAHMGLFTLLRGLVLEQRVLAGSRPFLQWLELYCTGGVVADILAGRKTVESRMLWGAYALVRPGWLLCLREGGVCVWAMVSAVHHHNSFIEAAHFHGRSLLPNFDVANMTDPEIGFYFFSMYRGQAQYGSPESALRRWFATSQVRNSVVCWSLVVLPRHTNIPFPRRVGNTVTMGERPMVAMRLRQRFRFMAILARRRQRSRVVAVRWRLFSQHVLLISNVQVQQRRRPALGTRLFQGALRDAFSQSRESGMEGNNSDGVTTDPAGSNLSMASVAVSGAPEEPTTETMPVPSAVPVTELIEVTPAVGSRKCDQCDLFKPRDEFSNNQWLKGRRRCLGCQGLNTVEPTCCQQLSTAPSTLMNDPEEVLQLPTPVSPSDMLASLHTLEFSSSTTDGDIPVARALRAANLIQTAFRDCFIRAFVNRLVREVERLSFEAPASQGDQEATPTATTQAVRPDVIVEPVSPQVASTTASRSYVTLNFSVGSGGQVGIETHVQPDQRLQRPGHLYHVVRQGGILDSTLAFDFICSPASCVPRLLSLDSELLAAGGVVDQTMPSPGVVVAQQLSTGVKVLHMCTQLGNGPKAVDSQHRTKEHKDTTVQRFQWLQQCLQELPTIITKGSTVAFPWMVGCHEQPALWKQWRDELSVFAGSHPELHVCVVQRSADVVKVAKQRRFRELAKATADAKASFCDAAPHTVRIGMQLIDCLHKQVLSSIEERSEQFATGEATSLASAAASVLNAADEKEARGRKQVAADNEAHSAVFRSNIRNRIQSSELSLADVTSAQSTPAGFYGAPAQVRRSVQAAATEGPTRRVVLAGLRVGTTYNGRVGHTTGLSDVRGRLRVFLDKGNGPDGQPWVNVREQNVVDVGEAFGDTSDANIAPQWL